jgi:hypothetical protein
MNGISWHFGKQNYLELEFFFSKLDRQYVNIYVKGNIKKCKIYNMEDIDLNMPSLKKYGKSAFSKN